MSYFNLFVPDAQRRAVVCLSARAGDALFDETGALQGPDDGHPREVPLGDPQNIRRGFSPPGVQVRPFFVQA